MDIYREYSIIIVIAIWTILPTLGLIFTGEKNFMTFFKLRSKARKLTKDKIKNELFQLTWFIVRGVIRRRIGLGDNLECYAKRMYYQAKLAKLFGGAKKYLYGDSNAEAFNTYRHMRRFDVLTLNFGIGGTTSHQWKEFMQRSTWTDISKLLTRATAIQNVGGNNALQDQMPMSELSFAYLKKRNQVAILIPHVYYEILKPIRPNLKKDIKILNEFIRKNSAVVIDPNKYVDMNRDTIPDFGKLSDVVHYSASTIRDLIRNLNNV